MASKAERIAAHQERAQRRQIAAAGGAVELLKAVLATGGIRLEEGQRPTDDGGTEAVYWVNKDDVVAFEARHGVVSEADR